MKKLFTLLSAMTFTCAAFAQIPNPGFETWTSHGAYSTPDEWGNPDSVTGSLSSVYPVEKGTPGYPGTSYVKLTSKTVTILTTSLVVPGVVVSGKITISTSGSYSASGGFPNTTRPASFTGAWQYLPAAATDNPRIGAFLFRWNSTLNKRDTVAMIDTTLTGSVTTWTAFSLPFKYYSGKFPDSGIIVMSSSAAATTAMAGSYLYADDLAFAGTVPSGIVTVNNESPSISIYPNPASNTATLFYHSTTTHDLQVGISDVSGRTVKTINGSVYRGENNIMLDLKGMAQGIYFVKIVDGESTVEQKLIVF